MRKSKSVVTFFVLLLLVAFSGAAFAETIFVKEKKARFRAGPGTNYDILWEAPQYSPLEFLGKYKAWYVVRDHEGDVGWVHQQVIGKGRAAIVINEKANVRKGPGAKNELIFTVFKGWLFKVLDKKGDWYKVVGADGDQGWVIKNLLWVSK